MKTETQTETNLETLSQSVQTTKRDVERSKILFANKLATYDDMAAAAKLFSNALYNYQRAKYPAMKVKRMAYQIILR